ncbi:SRPBCC family protein [Alteromonas oceanisediminis]|uniref:SRPBCC family protein n=1 Tax=Alteromonas oceanisediminis TaxID=2836180 RepID=UPI001BD9C7DB|nr:SRPBCC family protein [Alteromonas oceanisediminis]MBT0586644.1 SRPBCC family protein [Alteromonas oceanisediminis]
MFNIRVERTINKPIDIVFAMLSEHENYQSFPGVDSSTLLEPGDNEKNGIGALRQVKLGPVVLKERIVAFMRPTLMEYRIEHSKPFKFVHELGQITLSEKDGKTDVVWISKGYIATPILGRLVLDPMINSQGAKGFASILKAIDRAS